MKSKTENDFIKAYEKEKEIRKQYSYKDGIALRVVGPSTPWEALYHYLYQDQDKDNVNLYIIRQINLYSELKAYSATECHAEENVIKAVSEYSKDKNTSFDAACDIFIKKYIRTAEMAFKDTLEELFIEYGFDEKPLADMIGYDRSLINKIRSGQRMTTKKLLYALCLFMDYDLDQCEEIFRKSPYPLHDCFPDNIFRAYVKSTNRSLQPFIDIVWKKLKYENHKSYRHYEQQQKMVDFFDPDRIYSYLVITDFKDGDGYDFSINRRKEMQWKMSGIRKTYDENIDVKDC